MTGSLCPTYLPNNGRETEGAPHPISDLASWPDYVGYIKNVDQQGSVAGDVYFYIVSTDYELNGRDIKQVN